MTGYRQRVVLFFAVAGAALAADLATKAWAFARIGHPAIEGSVVRDPLVVVDGVLSFETHLNEGALYGIGQGWTDLFVVLSVLAGAGILVWVLRPSQRDLGPAITIALGLILGGTAGNLYDRLGFAGQRWSVFVEDHVPGELVRAVRDWIHFEIEAIGFDWAVFNIADSCLVVGAGILIFCAFSDPVAATEGGEESMAGEAEPGRIRTLLD